MSIKEKDFCVVKMLIVPIRISSQRWKKAGRLGKKHYKKQGGMLNSRTFSA